MKFNLLLPRNVAAAAAAHLSNRQSAIAGQWFGGRALSGATRVLAGDKVARTGRTTVGRFARPEKAAAAAESRALIPSAERSHDAVNGIDEQKVESELNKRALRPELASSGRRAEPTRAGPESTEGESSLLAS